MTALLTGERIRKTFGAQKALDGVDFELARAQIKGLIGANGAGKSTLLKILAGALTPDSGHLRLDGELVRLNSMRDANQRGIALVSQELNLFPALSVLENLEITGTDRTLASSERRRTASELLSELGLDVSLSLPVNRLPLSDRQLVEIARAMLQRPRVLIMDEPTSALHAREKLRLFEVIRRLRAREVGIIYVSHFLEEVLEIVDELIVLRNGKRVPISFKPSQERLSDLVGAMLGDTDPQTRADVSAEPAPRVTAPEARAIDAAPLIISQLKGPQQLLISSLTVEPGSVVGLAGLAGAGVEELFAILFGRVRARAGTILLPSGAGGPRSIWQAVCRGVAYVPADRKRIGLMLQRSIAENAWAVRTLVQMRDGVLLNHQQLERVADTRCTALNVKASSVNQTAGELSGGNQQKIVFAKWLEANPSLVLLDDPTRGIDIGAKREMHTIIQQLADQGRVVLMHSSDPLELVQVAARVHVFVDGHLRGTLAGAELTEHTLVSSMNQRASTSSPDKDASKIGAIT